MKEYTLAELIEYAVDYDGESHEVDCNFKVREDGITYKVHTAAVCNRDLLLYSDKACLNYVIDTYGDRHTIECINIEN